jgi:hypothetical protein
VGLSGCSGVPSVRLTSRRSRVQIWKLNSSVAVPSGSLKLLVRRCSTNAFGNEVMMIWAVPLRPLSK